MICENGGCMSKLPGTELIELIRDSKEKAGIYKSLVLDTLAQGTVEDCFLINENEMVTTDFGPLVGEDYRTAGRIAALNAISDVYVCGGRPRYAMILLVLSYELDKKESSDLLSGIFDICNQEGIYIAGGHTIRGSESLAGLAVIGERVSDKVISKKGAKVGDKIWISKPLGTGLALRAYYNKLLNKDAYDEAITIMLQSNRNSVNCIAGYLDEIHAMTDITGFGFIGHLTEMLEKNQGAVLFKEKIPLLNSLTQLNAMYMTNSYIINNYNYAIEKIDIRVDFEDICDLSLFDPQTNGPVIVIAKDSLNITDLCDCFNCVGEITAENILAVV